MEQPSIPQVLMTKTTTPLSNVTVRTIVTLLATLPNCTFLSFIYISSCFVYHAILALELQFLYIQKKKKKYKIKLDGSIPISSSRKIFWQLNYLSLLLLIFIYLFILNSWFFFFFFYWTKTNRDHLYYIWLVVE